MERKSNFQARSRKSKVQTQEEPTAGNKVQDESELKTILLESAKTKDLATFGKIVRSSPDIAKNLTSGGKALIHWASISGSPGIVVELLNSGANVDLQDSKGYTALHYSVIWSKVECTKILLASGAGFSLVTADGETAIDMARRYKNWSAVDLLEKQERYKNEK